MSAEEIITWIEGNEAQICCDVSRGKKVWCVWHELRGWTTGASIREAVEARVELDKQGARRTSVVVKGDY